MTKNTYIASENDEGRKLIKFITSIYKKTPNSIIYKTFRKGNIKINSKKTKDPNYLIKNGDVIDVYGIDQNDIFLIEKVKNTHSFDIVYEDENVLLINKEEGVQVHSSHNSLDSQVYSYLNFSQINSFKPSHVGRLDKLTSGLIIYAKNYKTLKMLNEKQKYLTKIYKFIPQNFIADNLYQFNLKKNEYDKKMFVSKDVDSKISSTKIWSENNEYFAQILTGRKHQIRVTCAALNAPILGDTKYGGKPAKRMYLHSFKLVFNNLTNHLEYLNKKEFIALPKNWKDSHEVNR
ncbi:Pseudouridylate synthase [Mycoplasmopsis bovigenitalium]|uniref:RNA pseudouridylate synthase n=1 Tax=Mycoplasmopsis bovigenitalium TaxID=2112 RepID=A0A449AA50_9BACT|nr:RluA family pseudouridine synthase [Mycoplasmopsis bovigenitalium]VEU61101.1 Pseudouridylate synthase [Mycoplasmopsis bovigenitalium]